MFSQATVFLFGEGGGLVTSNASWHQLLGEGTPWISDLVTYHILPPVPADIRPGDLTLPSSPDIRPGDLPSPPKHQTRDLPPPPRHQTWGPTPASGNLVVITRGLPSENNIWHWQLKLKHVWFPSR